MGVRINSVTTTTSTTTTTTTNRLKRELYKRTKHDSEFSDWKILVGPSDWKDYLQNKDNAPKYRTQNVPNCAACSGVYELGVSLPQSGRRGRNLNSKHIIAVYIGQADNVRNRLQQYGCEGSHLEKGYPNLELNDSKVQGLFTGIFSKGFPIVYRWAPMRSKTDAEKAETRLLDTFDYAWNKEKNGDRRPNDIHKILDRYASRPTKRLLPIIGKLKIIPPKKVGIKIRNCEPLTLENRSSFYVKQDTGSNILSRIFKLGRSRPIVVSKELGLDKDHTSICGVALGQGSVCTVTPVGGRKRCVDHKGIKVNGFNPKSIANQYGPEGFSLICGVSLDDGTFCTRETAGRRKLCDEHNGKKISGGSSGSVITEEKCYVDDPALKTRVPCEYGVEVKTDMTCGAVTLDGSLCKRKAGKGGIWCWQHGPKQVDSLSSNGQIPSTKFDNESHFYSSFCVAMTQKGSVAQGKLGLVGNFVGSMNAKAHIQVAGMRVIFLFFKLCSNNSKRRPLQDRLQPTEKFVGSIL